MSSIKHDWHTWSKIAIKLYYDYKNSIADFEISNLLNISQNRLNIPIEYLKNSEVLDLCCGWGRHSFILLKKGFKNITAIEKSPTFISKFKEILTRNKIHTNIRIVEDDFLKYKEPNKKFNLIFNLWTSFGISDNHSENIFFLSKVYNLLTKNGIFILDVMNPEILKKKLNEVKSNNIIFEQEKLTYWWEKKWLKSLYLILGQIMNLNNNVFSFKLIEFEKIENNLKLTESGEIHQILYNTIELKKNLKDLNFEIVDIFGDFNGTQIKKNSPRIIIFARKG